MEQMKKISKWALIFLKIWKCVMIVSMTVGCASILWQLLAPYSSPNATVHLTLSYLKFTLAPGVVDQIPTPLLCIAISVILVGGIFTLYIISMLRRVFEPMSAGLPFDCQVGTSIRKIAWINLIGDVLTQILWAVLGVAYYFCLDLPAIFQSELISDCRLYLNMNLNFLVTFFLLLLVSYVFQYGQELQKLSDETL